MRSIKSSWVYFSIEMNSLKLPFANFLARFAGQVFLNKDSTIWLDGARPVNTYILPSFPGNRPAELHGYPLPKIHLKV
jgi:hypothetical protein